MTTNNGEKKEAIKKRTEKAKEKAKPWIFRYARAGHLAKGLVYFVIGLLAGLPAIGINGKFTTSEGAIYTIAKQPFGFILVLLLALGLLGFSIWGLLQVIYGVQRRNGKWKELAQRVGYGFITLIYLAFSINAFRILFHAQVKVSGHKYQELSAIILKYPFGKWIIAIIGATFIGAGIGQWIWALSGRYKKRLKCYEMSEKAYLITSIIGRIGYTARSAIFVVIGVFLIMTAWKSNPNDTKGLDGALAALIKQPFGKWILGAVAIGLMIFGFYMCMEARFKRMDEQKTALSET